MDASIILVGMLLVTFKTVLAQCPGPSIYHSADDVTISYPVHPNGSTHDRHCEWRFQKVRMVIRVEVVTFDLKGNVHCDSGLAPHVEVLPVVSTEDGNIERKMASAGRWCGKISSATLQIRSDVIIVFRTENSHDVGSFQIKISHQDKLLYCDSDVQQLPLVVSPGSSVFVYSPGYPISYPDDIHCHWNLRSNSSDLVLTVESMDFQLEAESECRYDNVTISGVTGDGDHVARCGLQNRMFGLSSGLKTQVNLTTDIDVHFRGFALKILATQPYNTRCITFGSRALAAYPTPSLLSLPHNGETSDQISCSWLIQAETKDHVVYVETVRWDDDVLTCGYKKSFHVYDGRSNAALRLVSSCGNKRPFGFLRSTGRHLYIQADLTVNRRKTWTGFTMKYFSRHRYDFASSYDVPSSGISYMWIPPLTSSNQHKLIYPLTFTSTDAAKCVEAAVNTQTLAKINGTFTAYFNAYDGSTVEGLPLGYCSPLQSVQPAVSGSGRRLTLLRQNNTRDVNRHGWYLGVKVNDDCFETVAVLDVKQTKRLEYRVPQFTPGVIACRWKLMNRHGGIRVHSVIISPTQPSVGREEGCSQMYLASYETEKDESEEEDEKLIKKWCPGTTSYQGVMTSGRYMMLVYVADVKRGNGTTSYFNVSMVGGFFGCEVMKSYRMATDEKRFLLSPGFPSYNYPNNLNCTLLIETWSPNHVITLEIISLDLGGRGDNCTEQDSLTLFENSDDQAPIIVVLCGSGHSRRRFSSSSRNMRLRFVSKRKYTHRGFKLLYYQETTEEKPKCYSHIQAKLTPEIYVYSKYTSHNQCSWLIEAWFNRTTGITNSIVVEIVDLNLDHTDQHADQHADQHTVQQCDMATGRMQVYDGRGNESALLGRLCGDQGHRGRTFRSTGRLMYMEFISQAYGTNFTMKIHQEISVGCGKNVYEVFAGIQPACVVSPLFPTKHRQETDCEWRVVSGGTNSRVSVKVIDIHMDGNCSNNFIKVYDGYDNSSGFLGQWCGLSTPLSLGSTGSYMFIAFRSNGVHPVMFRLEYSTVEETRSHFGVIVGGVVGGAACLLLVTACICVFTSRTTSQSSSLSTRTPASESVILNSHSNTVFVVNPVYVNGSTANRDMNRADVIGSDSSCDVIRDRPPSYDSVVHAGSLHSRREDLPSRSSLAAYHVTTLHVTTVPGSFRADEYLVPVSREGTLNKSQILRRLPAELVRIPETSRNEYAEPAEPVDDVTMTSSPHPYELDLPQAPPPPTRSSSRDVSSATFINESTHTFSNVDSTQPPPNVDSTHPSTNLTSAEPAPNMDSAIL